MTKNSTPKLTPLGAGFERESTRDDLRYIIDADALPETTIREARSSEGFVVTCSGTL